MYVCHIIKVYLPIINLKSPDPNEKGIAYTTLKAICKHLNVSYQSASRGQRSWVVKDGKHVEIRTIYEIEIVKRKHKPKAATL